MDGTCGVLQFIGSIKNINYGNGRIKQNDMANQYYNELIRSAKPSNGKTMEYSGNVSRFLVSLKPRFADMLIMKFLF